MDGQQNLSCAQAVSRREAKEEIKAFKANIIVNIRQLTKIIITVLWEINREEYNTIDQLAYKLVRIVKQSVNISIV